MVQWLRIHLPIPETQVQALAGEDPTCRRAAKPMRHPQLLSLRSRPRNKRSHHNEKPEQQKDPMQPKKQPKNPPQHCKSTIFQ